MIRLFTLQRVSIGDNRVLRPFVRFVTGTVNYSSGLPALYGNIEVSLSLLTL